MLGAILFILGGSIVYVGILKITSPVNVTTEENENRRKITEEKKRRLN